MVVRFLDSYFEEFTSYLNNSIVPQMEALVKQVSLSLISLLKVLWNFIIGFVISIYVLYSKEYFAGQAKKIVFIRNQLISLLRMSVLPAIPLSVLSVGKSLIPLLSVLFVLPEPVS